MRRFIVGVLVLVGWGSLGFAADFEFTETLILDDEGIWVGSDEDAGLRWDSGSGVAQFLNNGLSVQGDWDPATGVFRWLGEFVPSVLTFDVEDLQTSGAVGTAAVSDGAGALTMVDVLTEAELASSKTISGNWVNTANPWADNEVSDTLTIGSGSTMSSPPAIGGVAPAAGAFTTLSSSGLSTLATVSVPDLGSGVIGRVQFGNSDDMYLGYNGTGDSLEVAKTGDANPLLILADSGNFQGSNSQIAFGDDWAAWQTDNGGGSFTHTNLNPVHFYSSDGAHVFVTEFEARGQVIVTLESESDGGSSENAYVLFQRGNALNAWSVGNKVTDSDAFIIGKGANLGTPYFKIAQADGATSITGSLAVNGAAITTDDTTFALLNTTATTVNAFGAATALNVAADTNLTAKFGRTLLDSRTTDEATFSHVDMTASTEYAIKQLATGETRVNSKTGVPVSIRQASTELAQFNTAGIIFTASGGDVDFKGGVIKNTTGNLAITPNAGAGTTTLSGRTNITKGGVTNLHQPTTANITSTIRQTSDATVVIASDDAGTVGSGIVMTSAPASGNNKHWVLSHEGVTNSDQFSIAYVTSAADSENILFNATTSDEFTLSTGGNLAVTGTMKAGGSEIDLGDGGGFSGAKFNPTSTELEFYIDGTFVGSIDTGGAYTDEVP